MAPMATRPVSLAFDAGDPRVPPAFWAGLLGWSPGDAAPAGADPAGADPPDCTAATAPESDGCEVALEIPRVHEPKQGRNRIHLDLASRSAEDEARLVTRAEELGARRIDIGQRYVPRVVLGDPEGNEFCVREPTLPMPTPARSVRFSSTPSIRRCWRRSG